MTDSCSSIKINPAFYNTVIAFNNSGVVLKDRTESDLIDLALMARRSSDPTLLKLFDCLPSLAELQAMKMRVIEQQVFKII